MPATDVLEIAKPFAWMAALAFLVGFCSYIVLGQANPASAQEEPYAAARISAPSSDAWNIPKHI